MSISLPSQTRQPQILYQNSLVQRRDQHQHSKLNLPIHAM